MDTPQELGRAERREQGRQARQNCSRTLHAEWKPRSRTHDPIELLDKSNADRIPGLIRVRYGRMSQSPFAFFRGTAVIQARDLAASPVSGITVQACGDCHLMNFGGFATPERSLVFDINDFDETFPAPWEWDIKRLVASFAVAARHLTFSEAATEKAVRAAVASYRERMSEYADSKALDLWYTADSDRGSSQVLQEGQGYCRPVERGGEQGALSHVRGGVSEADDNRQWTTPDR